MKKILSFFLSLFGLCYVYVLFIWNIYPVTVLVHPFIPILVLFLFIIFAISFISLISISFDIPLSAQIEKMFSYIRFICAIILILLILYFIMAYNLIVHII